MKIKRYQQGGQAPMPADPAMVGGDPAAQGSQDPLMQLFEMSMAALKSQDCGMAMQVCEGFAMLIEQANGGGQAPVGAPAGEPVFKKGGKISRRKGCKK